MTNWTPRNIFDIRDKVVMCSDGRAVDVRLYSDGWSLMVAPDDRFVGDVKTFEALCVISACGLLNDWQAER